MRLFWRYARRHWWKIAIALVFLELADLAQLLVVPQVRAAFNQMPAPPDAIRRIFLLMLVTPFLRMAWRLVMWPCSRRVGYELRRELFAHLQRVDPSYYHDHPSGDLISRASSDVEGVRRFFAMGFPVFFDVLFLMPLAIYGMILIDWRLGLVVAVPIVLSPSLSIFLTRRLSRAFRASQDAVGDLSARAQEDIAGTRVLKTYAREDAAGANYLAINDDVRRKFVVLSRYWSLITPYFHLVPQGATLLLVIIGSGLALAGRSGHGDLMAFILYVGILTWPTFALGWGLTMLQRLRASAERIEEVLAVPLRERAGAEAGPDEVRGEFSFRDLTFAYNGQPVLKNLSLEVRAGEILGLAGPTGGGKTTLLSLAVALVEPPPGAVLLDGVDVRTIAPEKLRRHVALVQQTPYLFSRTLAENLAFPRPEASAEDVQEAVRIAGLVPDVRQFDAGLETLVGDRGVTLSGGQRLRVALGRALVARPGVLLLDDAFSAVDVYTEESVWNALRRVMAGRTIVVVSHRISVLRRCDRIAVVEGGRVAELGTHAELVAGNGFYARTFALQELFES